MWGNVRRAGIYALHKKCPTRILDGAQGHLTLMEYQVVFGRHGLDFDPAKIFTVVRNPWSWHVSWFNYIRQDYDGKSGHKIEHQLFQDFEFVDYVHWLGDLSAERSPQGYLQKQLSDWLIDDQGNLAVEVALRQETLERDLNQWVKKYKLDLIVPSIRVNTSQGEYYRHYYNVECREIIRKRHSSDISLFGYDY